MPSINPSSMLAPQPTPHFGPNPTEWTDLHAAAADLELRHTTNLVVVIDNAPLESLDNPDAVGMTALLIAAQRRNPVALTLLLHRGADIKATDNDKWSALHHAAFSGCKTGVEILRQSGAIVSAPARGGSTPLHLAVGQNHESVAMALVEAGARLDAVDEYGRTPADIARQAKNLRLAHKLAV